MRLPSWLAQHLAALRALLVFTILLGLAYPLAMVAVAQIPGLKHNADGSLVKKDGQLVGSRLVGQSFADHRHYFQSRPSAAGATGYDPTATAATNLGPESVVDELTVDGKKSLLTQVCARSKAIGELEGVDGRRPNCTAGGVGAVLGVFRENGKITRVVSLNEQTGAPFVATYEGVKVELAALGGDYAKASTVVVRGDAPAKPVIPADAVTASGSGLDPHISPAYAKLQAPRVALARGISVDQVKRLIEEHTTGRALGFMGEPGVNVLELNLHLDRSYPKA